VQRADVVDAVVAERDDATLVVSPGASSGLVFARDPHPATIHNMELGYATAVAYGIALGRPDRRVIALEGDGSMFAGIQVLGTLARFPVSNLTVVVVANGIWGTGAGNVATTPGSAAQLAEIARACGHPAGRVLVTAEAPELRTILARAKSEAGPWIVCAVTERSSTDRSGARPRVQFDSVEAIDLTRRYLRSK
jgi:thiamine pyrophosphate-dependent acetolactate synthase large subunit-like protein